VNPNTTESSHRARGWYSDSPTSARWWDGSDWLGQPVPTGALPQGAVAMEAPLVASAGASPALPAWPSLPAPAAAAEPAPAATAVATVTAPAPTAPAAPVAVTPPPSTSALQATDRSSGLWPNSTWVTFVALSSVVHVVAVEVFTTLDRSAAQTPGTALVGVAALSVICAVLTVAAAFLDRRALLRSGNAPAASAFWILLTPFAYLLARVVYNAKGGWRMFVVYLVASGAVVVWLAMAATQGFLDAARDLAM
jgi:hypothetical protein